MPQRPHVREPAPATVPLGRSGPAATDAVRSRDDAVSTPVVVRFLATTWLAGALSRVELLTPRELEVFLSMRDGATNRQIGRRLFVTERTVKAHVAAVVAKLAVESRLQACITASVFAVDTDRCLECGDLLSAGGHRAPA